MKVSVESNAKAFLLEKNRNIVTLFLRSTGGGWCGIIQVPELAYKVPEVPEGFQSYDIDGLTIYIQKSAAVGAEHISFVLKGFWIFKTVVVEGVKYPKL